MTPHNIKSSELCEPSYKNGTMYAVTCRHNPTYKKNTKIRYTDQEKRDIYSNVIEKLLHDYNCDLLEIAYEQKGGLHFHAVLLFHKVPWLKNIKMKDIHFRFEKLYYYDGWASYIDKERIELAKAQQQHQTDYYISSPLSFMSSPPQGGLGGIDTACIH